MTHLFTLGKFTMHSGDIGRWKIECDALTDSDMECIAFMLAERLPAFGSVVGIPTGGLRLADALSVHATVGPVLVADDVLTTGSSMKEKAKELERSDHPLSVGAVIFARSACPAWVTPLFSMARASEKSGSETE